MIKIISQPIDTNTEEEIIKLLNPQEGYDFFYIIVAYVKKSGVERLRTALEGFRRNGGKVYASVGIGQKNTSVQGLESLLEVCDEAWVFHNESFSTTFHPKVYIFEKGSEKGTGIVGSSNLTKGGLSTNYEINYLIEFDLKDHHERDKFDELKKIFTFYSTPSDLCKKLDLDLVSRLSERYLGNENQQEVPNGNDEIGDARAEGIFGSKRYYPRTGTRTKEIREPKEEVPKKETLKCDWSSKGKLRWKKKLTNRDCQIVNTGTSPTGSLSLTAARWKDNGVLIDQTTYFRSKVFQNFNWYLPRKKFNVEVAEVNFCVKIDGVDRGSHILVLRHNPNWESKEHNYTTGLSWGTIVNYINDQKMVGKYISIYDPPEGKKEPFFLEIN